MRLYALPGPRKIAAFCGSPCPLTPLDPRSPVALVQVDLRRTGTLPLAGNDEGMAFEVPIRLVPDRPHHGLPADHDLPTGGTVGIRRDEAAQRRHRALLAHAVHQHDRHPVV